MTVEINRDHLNESKQRLFIQNFLQQGSQPHSLAFGRDSKAGRKTQRAGEGLGKREQEALDMFRKLEIWKQAIQRQDLPCDWLGEGIWLCLITLEVGIGESWQLLSLDHFWTDCYRLWLPGLNAADCGSKFCFE